MIAAAAMPLLSDMLTLFLFRFFDAASAADAFDAIFRQRLLMFSLLTYLSIRRCLLMMPRRHAVCFYYVDDFA